MPNPKNKVNLSSLPDLKNATDDEIVKILTNKGYTQVFTLVDVRLVIGFLSVLVAAAAGGYDYFVGFEKAKTYTTIGVSVYFLLNMALTAWMMYVEKGTIYQGSKDGKKISVMSTTKKFSPIYDIKVTETTTSKSTQAKKPFTDFFDSHGYLVTKPLEEWIDGILTSTMQDAGAMSTGAKGSKKRK
ncbi:signal peptidase complex subunit 2 [Lipomyces tetrasporus]|uniref:Signal peptidase complex subunit 2 n=1 Tax=Lipomyces tetrasporus TaxID=54092 RepID=A0AAD7VPZ1_9ASCO|nr:signal peptidase complex subunit 2 [Lipomyces tetrasporus]KAJ8098362.1 signal peptidase complex subunit 2 [Lipomyces tetrasporus]